MDQAQLVAAITSTSAFLSPRIIAMVPGGKAEKQRAGNVIAFVTGLATGAVEAGVFTGGGFTFAAVAAFLMGAVGTKAGQQAIYDGYWKDKLSSSDEPEADAVSAMEQQRTPAIGSMPPPAKRPVVRQAMDVPQTNPVHTFQDTNPVRTFQDEAEEPVFAAPEEQEWGAFIETSEDEPRSTNPLGSGHDQDEGDFFAAVAAAEAHS